jgi:hypothetical protein
MKKAFFTLVRNEKDYLPILLKYYGQFFDQKDMYVLDHNSTDGSTDNLSCNIKKLDHPFVEHKWMLDTVKGFQKELLENYEVVVFAEADEIVYHVKGLDYFIENLKEPYGKTEGYDVFQDREELSYDPSKTILSQRKYWKHTNLYRKKLIAKQPCHFWSEGFHDCSNEDISPDLYLLHLHHFDQNIFMRRHEDRKNMAWSPVDVEKKMGIQWQRDPAWFFMKGEEIPKDIIEANWV